MKLKTQILFFSLTLWTKEPMTVILQNRRKVSTQDQRKNLIPVKKTRNRSVGTDKVGESEKTYQGSTDKVGRVERQLRPGVPQIRSGRVERHVRPGVLQIRSGRVERHIRPGVPQIRSRRMEKHIRPRALQIWLGRDYQTFGSIQGLEKRQTELSDEAHFQAPTIKQLGHIVLPCSIFLSFHPSILPTFCPLVIPSSSTFQSLLQQPLHTFNSKDYI